MKKLAVIFPGIGYTADKPLLYYSGRLAERSGYKLIKINFHDFPEVVPENRSSMLSALELATRQSEEALDGVLFSSYEDVIFISKSIGTVAAAAYAKKHELKARYIYFTPLAQTFSFAEEGNGIIFHGTADPWAEHDTIRNLIDSSKIQARIYEGADHSLETGDIQRDIELLNKIIGDVDEYILGKGIYSMDVLNMDGSITSLSDYRGKVLLIINSATGCGFTPQYSAIEDMYLKYRKDGFEVLDFPCNQFANQASGSNDEIHSFCTSRYNISFTQFAKIEVNGSNQSELFSYLKDKQGFHGFNSDTKEAKYLEKIVRETDPDFEHNNNIKWNFTKFLVNRKGEVVRRFEPMEDLKQIDSAVQELL